MDENHNPYEKLKLENQLCFPLYACARRVMNLYNPYLKEHGLTYTQYLVFLVLWEKDHVPVGEICRTLYLDNGTLTPLLKKMEKAGWITRSRARKDERIVMIDLTEAGRELKEKAVEIPECVSNCLCISPEEAGVLYKSLYHLLDELSQ